MTYEGTGQATTGAWESSLALAYRNARLFLQEFERKS